MHENIFDALSRCCSGPAAQVTSGADWVTLDYVGVSQCHTTGTVFNVHVVTCYGRVVPLQNYTRYTGTSKMCISNHPKYST